MKRKALAIVLTLLMLVSVLPMGAFAASYTDTEGHWAETSIDRWTEAKVLEGMGNNTYAPDDHLTRAQAMTIFSRLLNLVETADISKLTDVAADAWYAPYIEKGYAYQIINGTSDTTFDPSGSITREQFFSIFARAMGIPSAATCDKTFTDLDQVSSWFVEEGTVYSMINRGYLDGYPDGSLQPKGLITRAEVAKVLDNAISDYITADGTYAISGDGIVVVLAKNVKLTGTFTGHIVSSCVNATLDLSGLTRPAAKVAVNPAADNVTVNGTTKVTNPPYTPDSAYNPNSAPYVYVLQDNTNIITARVGGGGGGGEPAKYKVTAEVKVPFGKSPMQLDGGSYSSDVKLSTVLNTLADDTQGVQQALQDGFDKITKTKTTTVGEYVVTVTPNRDGDVTNTFNVSMTKSGAPVDMKQIVKDELNLYHTKMIEKGKAANIAENAGWKDLDKMFTPDALFTFSGTNNTVMTTMTTDVYAGLFAKMLKNLATVYDNLPTNPAYQYKSEITDAVGSHWDNYDIFGIALANIDAILGGQGVMLQNTLDKNPGEKTATGNDTGILLNVVENVETAEQFTTAVDNLSGRNYVSSPEVQALIQAAFKPDDKDPTKTKYNVAGEYRLTVTVEDLQTAK